MSVPSLRWPSSYTGTMAGCSSTPVSRASRRNRAAIAVVRATGLSASPGAAGRHGMAGVDDSLQLTAFAVVDCQILGVEVAAAAADVAGADDRPSRHGWGAAFLRGRSVRG
mgnify:CR=1 FL=1